MTLETMIRPSMLVLSAIPNAAFAAASDSMGEPMRCPRKHTTPTPRLRARV